MPQENQDAALSVGGCVPSFPERPHLCLEPAGLGLLILLLPLVPVFSPASPPPPSHLARLLGGLTSGASVSLPTPSRPS